MTCRSGPFSRPAQCSSLRKAPRRLSCRATNRKSWTSDRGWQTLTLSTSFRSCRRGRTTSATRDKLQAVPALPNWDLSTFRQRAFVPKFPALLPQGGPSSQQLPAVKSWFKSVADDRGIPCSILNHEYLSRHGNTPVTLEVTSKDAESSKNTTFDRFTAPLSLFLDWMATQHHPNPQQQPPSPSSQKSFYLAQHQLTSLPLSLQSDLPTPDLVLQAGKGDVYDSNIWIGTPPTYTPLHRDPNPNFFLQLAGRKVVRLLPPDVGRQLYEEVRTRLARNGSDVFRGEEMMQGQERDMLERAVWGGWAEGETDGGADLAPHDEEEAWEAVIGEGTALFIPLGWWHSVKGIGTGVSASVNWWFR